MASALEDEELALSINPSHTRRGSARSPSDSQQHPDPFHAAHSSTTISSRHPAAQAQIRKDRLGQYNIIKTLGEGSFGKVKLAVHAISGQKVALKIISRRKLMARDMAGRVEREIQYLQLLRHPHIIKLYTVIPQQNEIIMVLEYAGSELFNYIVEHGKMVEDKARTFFQQIVCAVEYCHRHKIVHRDLKPENLLLDDNLHVKIADFGLSNIMTDGNFLKTSCGSPNYAAPEVISGKLYAGPEVDVWSCGVILYVLLVGRLPFDDEYIPALFKKIAQGNYHVPQYLSQGAARLIKKMLQVSPVNRITVEGIRNDPWFMKNLPDYLQPPVEEFLDTGVDPAKPIDPRNLAPTKSSEVVEKLHNSVVGKLGKTMGYHREDVQQALAVDEPNAIKDAYLIVRENHLMRETPSIAGDPKWERFLEQSPPIKAQSPISALAEANQQSLNALTPSSPLKNQSPSQNRPQMQRGSVNPSPLAESRSPGGTIAVLPSSLPDYHRAFMAGQPKPAQQQKEDETADPKQSSGETGDKSRRPNLNPHSKSQVNLERMARPEGMTAIHPPEKKKTRPPKWQFGIRSKNPAAEAMLAIYRALKAMGAEWETPKTRRPGGSTSDDATSPDERKDNQDYDSGSDEGTDDTDSSRRQEHNGLSKSSSRSRGRSRYGSWNDWGYAIPEDPWIINVRFKKSDMLPPGMLNSSANNSRADLSAESGSAHGMGSKGSDVALEPRRRSSAMSSSGSISAMSGQGSLPGSQQGSASNSRTNLDGNSRELSSPTSSNQSNAAANPANTGPPAANSTAAPGPGTISTVSLSSAPNGESNDSSRDGQIALADDSSYVYMTIQLYAIEKETYLVDFKCAGYERVVRRFFREALERENITVDEDDKSDHDDNHEDENDSQSDDENNSQPNEVDGWQLEYGSGRPRQGGYWEAMRAREEDVSPSSRTKISRTDYANQAQEHEASGGRGKQTPNDADGDPATKLAERKAAIREHLIPYGRATEEKQVSSSFPFLDVAAKLIIQLTKSD